MDTSACLWSLQLGVFFSVGLGMLTVSTVLPTICQQKDNQKLDSSACPLSLQLGLFFSAIYIIALTQGCHKPCAQAFAADQFDEDDPVESRSKSSFFNWWYFAMCVGATSSFLLLSYIQDNISWVLSFGIQCGSMAIDLMVFLLGRKTYRYYSSPTQFLLKLKQLVALRYHLLTKQSNEMNHEDQIELKGIISRLFPIWGTGLMYAVVFAQTTTLFTKQSSTVDRRIGQHFEIPPVAFLSFISVTNMTFIPIYDKIFVPVAMKVTGLHSGITMLQRIGSGYFLAIISMIVAALVKMKRLKIVRDFGLEDIPKATIPMSLWWFVPQYIIFGIADAFAMVGWQEFFYNQVPGNLRSVGLSLYLSILGIGSIISTLIITVIDRASSRSRESWFDDNLNRAHLDYFYWLLAALNTVSLLLYLYFASCYQYKSRHSSQQLNNDVYVVSATNYHRNN